jgi:hypothetical protein
MPHCWNFMGVLAFVCCDHGLQIVRSSFDMLAHRTTWVRAFVVAPADIWMCVSSSCLSTGR